MKKIISMILVLALVLCGVTVVASAADGDVTVFSGEYTITDNWSSQWLDKSTTLGGSFDVSAIVPGSCFVVNYNGPETVLYLVFQGESAGSWSMVTPTDTQAVDSGYSAVYTYDAIMSAVGTIPSDAHLFVQVGEIAEPVTVTEVTFAAGSGAGGEEEEEQPTDVATVELFNGEHTISTAWTTQDNYTTLWGGSFDASNIVPGGAFFITYAGEKDQIELVLNGPGWNKIPVSSVSEVEGGYVATVTYEDIVAIYGSDFSGLGAVCPSSMEITEPMVIKNVTWGPATGVEGGEEEEVPEEPVDPNTVVLFEGEFSTSNAWDAGIQVNTNNNDWAPNGFDVVNTFVPGSYFTITYTGTAKEAILVFMDWDINKWIAVAPIHTEVIDNKYFVSYYSYRSMQLAYGSSDFSGVDAVCAGSRQSTGKTVVTNVSWTSVAPDFSNPNTGDAFSIGAAVIAVIASGLGLGITATKRRGE